MKYLDEHFYPDLDLPDREVVEARLAALPKLADGWRWRWHLVGELGPVLSLERRWWKFWYQHSFERMPDARFLDQVALALLAETPRAVSDPA